MVKNLPANAGDLRDAVLIPGLGRSPGEGIGHPLQYSWASLVAQLVKNPSAMEEAQLDSWVGKIPWRRERLPTPVFWSEEFHGPNPWGCKESDRTEQLHFHFHFKPTYVKSSLYQSPKGRQCQTMFKLPYNCTHLTH